MITLFSCIIEMSHTTCMATDRCRSGGIMLGDLPKDLIKDGPHLSFLPLQHIFLLILLWLGRASASHWPLCRFPPVLFATTDHILWWSLFAWYCSHFIFPFLFLPTPLLLWVLLLRFHCSLLRGFCLSLRIAVPHGSVSVLASRVILFTSLAPIISTLGDF